MKDSAHSNIVTWSWMLDLINIHYITNKLPKYWSYFQMAGDNTKLVCLMV